MIVKCEKCKSGFNLNETLIKEGGSTVRCSVCKNVFTVFPPKPATFSDLFDDDFTDTAMEETVALDLPPDMEDIEEESVAEGRGDSFERAFEDAMEEVVEDEVFEVSEDEPMPGKEETAELHAKKTETAAVKITGQKKKEKGRPRILLISLSILLFLILAFLVVFFLFPEILPGSIYSIKSTSEESVADAGVNKLDFEGVIGSFSTSGSAGKLYIIEGAVINNDQKSRSHILLKGSLLDEKGDPLVEETAYAGNTFTDEQLNTLPFDEIENTLKNKTGIDNSNVDIKPGASVPFMIIFNDLPEGLSEFTLEAVGSSYGN